jgi:hypothetical protein
MAEAEPERAAAEDPDPERRMREYAGGEIHVREGRVNRWLLVVYAVLAVWAVYYLVTAWGGLGPGLAR